MFRLFNLCFLILLPGFSAARQIPQHTPEESKVENMIKALPEVKALDNVYDTISNRHQRVKMTLTPPGDKLPFYKVEVGYQGTNRFEPHYYFYVNPQTDVILVEDLKYGDRPTLAVWRTRQRPDYTPENTSSLNTDSISEQTSDPSKMPMKSKAEFIYKK